MFLDVNAIYLYFEYTCEVSLMRHEGNIVKIFFYKFLIRVKNRKRIKILRLQNEKIF